MILNLERLELFKILEPRFKIDKVLILTKAIEYEGLTINEGIYLVSKPFRGFLGSKIVTIIDLEKTMKGHNFDISEKTHKKGFSCWRINLDYFEDIKEFKPLVAYSNFLWKGEDNDN